MKGETRFELLGGSASPNGLDEMAREVRAGLSRPPRSIPPKYFYDSVGSQLFDAICDLPEYYLTRAERALLERHADAIVERSRARTLVEIGSGMARKTGLLLGALERRVRSTLYVPFDIAPEPIAASAAPLLAAHAGLRIRGIVGDFGRDCARISVAAPVSTGARLFAFLGSTLGNLDERDAPAMLGSLARIMTSHDRLLLGVDLVKDPRVLHAAYNDAQGVTAAFNRNVLRVLARELDGDVDEDGFEHLAFYDPGRERIEMHLLSVRHQVFTLRGADVRAAIIPGERIMTEISRKFTRTRMEATLAGAALRLRDWLPDPEGAFALCVASTV
ncbi:MAG TPA: L-histidine N(alpha)-methyltransferase [Polyangiaceae bacterium]|nr:L-histidine N(alpha)-methyltransferase [Polyangiaceae bacterium]